MSEHHSDHCHYVLDPCIDHDPVRFLFQAPIHDPRYERPHKSGDKNVYRDVEVIMSASDAIEKTVDCYFAQVERDQHEREADEDLEC